MSVYIERWCQKHGEWSEDVDNPSECPACLAEGTAPSQVTAADLSRLRARVAELEDFVSEIAQWECDCDMPEVGERGTITCWGCRAKQLTASCSGLVAIKRDRLREIEVVDSYEQEGSDIGYYCPACGNRDDLQWDSRDVKHAPGCWLGQACKEEA